MPFGISGISKYFSGSKKSAFIPRRQLLHARHNSTLVAERRVGKVTHQLIHTKGTTSDLILRTDVDGNRRFYKVLEFFADGSNFIGKINETVDGFTPKKLAALLREIRRNPQKYNPDSGWSGSFR